MYPATPDEGLAVQVSETECAAPWTIVILKLAVAVLAGELESLTFTPKGNVPEEVGTPVISPELFKSRPPGKAPEEMLHT